MNVEEQHVAVVGEHRFQLVGELQHVFFCRTIKLSVGDVDDGRWIAVLVVVLLHPFLQEFLGLVERLVHVRPTPVIICVYPLHALHFLGH